MPREFSSDKPITTSKQDLFGRSEFAKKITKLCGRYTDKSTVIGVYGKWGEGKTSLLNMVGESLEANILQITFNPWFFKDEEQLLNAFFKLIAEKLGKNLFTKREQINNLISDYSESLGFFENVPRVGAAIKIFKPLTKVFKKKNAISTETARNRINDFIIQSQLNIVIFIDDIDRLDTNEVSTVFRLVKLLADFPRTTYILSFDPEIVARMLAPSYGGIIPDSGYQFLEKVVQVPLYIPKAHEVSILSFIQDTIRDVATETGFDLEIEDSKVVEIFVDGLEQLLNNPRKAIRFGNALRFTYPIVKGEVNTMDLLIVEAFKASLPAYYAFMRENKEIFLQDYLDEMVNEYMDVKDIASRATKDVMKSYPEKVSRALRQLTCKLFPEFLWNDPAEAKIEKKDSLIIQKRICTDEYFDRYFTFAIQPEEISDVHFNNHYIDTDNFSIDQIASHLIKDFEKYRQDRVTFKLATYRTLVKGENTVKLILAICKVSYLFQEKTSADWGRSFSLAALTVDTLVRALPENQAFQIAKEIVLSPTSMAFAAELIARLVMPESKEKPVTYFSGNKAKEIKERYIERLKELIEEKGFFEVIPEAAMARQLVWWHDIEPYNLKSIVSDLLDTDPSAPLKLLRIFTPTLHSSSGVPGELTTFKADFTSDEYHRMDAIVGVSRIYEILNRQYGLLSGLPTVEAIGLQEPLDDKTLIGKFQRYYHLQMGLMAAATEGRRLD